MFHFEKIYALAKADNKAALIKLLEEGICIDEFKKGQPEMTAAAMLAKEGETKAVQLLMSLGSVKTHVVRGYALAGNYKLAEALCREHEISLIHAAIGAAQRGDRAYAEKMRIEKNASVDNLARAAALGGHFAYSEELRVKHGASVNSIAVGAALGGKKGYAEQLRMREGADASKIARAAAAGGYIEYAEELRLDPRLRVNVTKIAHGAAIGGFTDYIDRLRKKCHSININWVAHGSAFGGYTHHLQQLQAKCILNYDYIYAGFKKSGHIEYAQLYRPKQEKRISLPADSILSSKRKAPTISPVPEERRRLGF